MVRRRRFFWGFARFPRARNVPFTYIEGAGSFTCSGSVGVCGWVLRRAAAGPVGPGPAEVRRPGAVLAAHAATRAQPPQRSRRQSKPGRRGRPLSDGLHGADGGAEGGRVRGRREHEGAEGRAGRGLRKGHARRRDKVVSKGGKTKGSIAGKPPYLYRPRSSRCAYGATGAGASASCSALFASASCSAFFATISEKEELMPCFGCSIITRLCSAAAASAPAHGPSQ